MRGSSLIMGGYAMLYEHLFGAQQATNTSKMPEDWQYRVERVLPFVYDELDKKEKFLFDNWFKEEKLNWNEIADQLGIKRPRVDMLARSIRAKFHAPIPEWIYRLPANEVITEDQYQKIKNGKMKLTLLGLKESEIQKLRENGIRNISQLRNATDEFLRSISGIGEFTVKHYREAIAYWDNLNDYLLDVLSHPASPTETYKYEVSESKF